METQIIQWLRDVLPSSPRVQVGPGDDGAILDWSQSSACVIACDTLVEGLDFTFETTTPEAVGHKVLGINLSDLAAMASHPVAATLSLVLPRSHAFALCQGVVNGLLPLAQRHELVLVGGDLSIWDGPLIATVNVIGEPGSAGPWRRIGAQPGDGILVTGQLGGSILGHHLTFEPRVRESLDLATRYDIRAALDVSDGLAVDVNKLATENSLKAILDLDSIPVSASAIKLAAQEPGSLTPLEHALQDGEDFELVLVATAAECQRIVQEQPLSCGISCIGVFTEGDGLWSRHPGGLLSELEPAGYEHGKS